MTQEKMFQRSLGRRNLIAAGGALAAMGALPARARAASTVKVGVIVPLSGPNAQFGINSRNGIQLVADQINASDGIPGLNGATIELVMTDATSAPTSAATVAQRMITGNRVVAVLGCYVSSLTIAVSEVTERRGIPLVTMSYADQVTSRGFKNVFQVSPKASVLGKAQLDATLALAKQAGDPISRVAIAYEDTAYGTSQATGVRAAAQQAGIEIVMDEAYPLGITDVTPLINRLRSSRAQAIFPVSYLNDSLLIIRSMRQQHIDIPAIGGAAGYVIPDFQKALGAYAEGVMSISPTNYDVAPDLARSFRERNGYFMVQEAVLFAAATSVLVQAMTAAKSADPRAIQEALATRRFCEGWAKAMPGGCIEFDGTGLNKLAIATMVQWQKGELVTIFPSEVAKAKPLWKGKTIL